MANRLEMVPMSIIVAVDEDGGFAKDGKIPWNVPDDMKHFQNITKGNVCIMGRRTYQDMLQMRKDRTGKEEFDEILPGRKSFVVTSNTKYETQGATVVPNIRSAIHSLDASDNREVFILGGLRMFHEALSWVTTVHMTLIEGHFNCDLFFPVVYVDEHFQIKSGHKIGTTSFLTYERRNW